jgi:hypothetical protein
LTPGYNGERRAMPMMIAKCEAVRFHPLRTPEDAASDMESAMGRCQSRAIREVALWAQEGKMFGFPEFERMEVVKSEEYALICMIFRSELMSGRAR